jgi:hypothetical protein
MCRMSLRREMLLVGSHDRALHDERALSDNSSTVALGGTERYTSWGHVLTNSNRRMFDEVPLTRGSICVLG